VIMRAFLLACLAIVVIAIGGYFLLGSLQQPTGVANTSDAARITTNWSWRRPTTSSECDARKWWQWIFVDFGDPSGESAACAISQ
jgi:fatty acid desaturase